MWTKEVVSVLVPESGPHLTEGLVEERSQVGVFGSGHTEVSGNLGGNPMSNIFLLSTPRETALTSDSTLCFEVRVFCPEIEWVQRQQTAQGDNV